MTATAVEARFFGALFRLHRCSCRPASGRRPQLGSIGTTYRHGFTTRQFSVSTARSTAQSPAAATQASEAQSQHSKAALHRSPDTANTNIHADLSSHMRHLMRRIPHSVAVVTSASPEPSDASPEASFRGMTVSSFNTVALSPTPLVSFNVKVPSATYSALNSSGTFLVHLLHSSEAGARICDVFARGNHGSADAFRQLAASRQDKEAVNIFSGAGTNGAPLLAGQGIMRVLRCKVLPGKQVRVGDHVVLVGEVLGIMASPNHASQSRSWQENRDLGDKLGLVYADRTYREVGKEISVLAGARSEIANKKLKQASQEHIEKTIGLNIRRGDEY